MAETKSGFSKEERDAMKERARELKAAASDAEALAEVVAKIASMDARDRSLAQRIHELVLEAAPDVAPRLWYGSPAYANAEGKVVCFFQESTKFKTRYCTLGFSDFAKLDDGGLWASSFAVLELTAADEKTIAALVSKAFS